MDHPKVRGVLAAHQRLVVVTPHFHYGMCIEDTEMTIAGAYIETFTYTY